MSIWGELKTRNVDGNGGLVTIIVQDIENSDVLMVAYANQEAVEKTLETSLAHYYSTSRKKLWLKGERSGNTQKVSEVLVDCDGDTIIYKVEQKGGACHRGYRTCFFRRIEGDKLAIVGKRLFNPDDVYGKK